MTDAQLEQFELLVDDAQADDATKLGRFVLSSSGVLIISLLVASLE